MFDNFPLWPDRASTAAGNVDALFIFLLIVSGLITLLIFTALIFFAARYRYRRGVLAEQIEGSTPLELTWSKGVLEPAGVVYPKPRMEKYQFSPDKPLSVFSGSFELVAKFSVPSTAPPGPAAMSGKLRYQACNNTMCLTPKNMDVAIQLDIVK